MISNVSISEGGGGHCFYTILHAMQCKLGRGGHIRFNPFPTNPLVVVYGMGGADSATPNISAPEGARRLIF